MKPMAIRTHRPMATYTIRGRLMRMIRRIRRFINRPEILPEPCKHALRSRDW